MRTEEGSSGVCAGTERSAQGSGMPTRPCTLCKGAPSGTGMALGEKKLTFYCKRTGVYIRYLNRYTVYLWH